MLRFAPVICSSTEKAHDWQGVRHADDIQIDGDLLVTSGRAGGAMGQSWHPSYWGKQATKCNDSTLTLDGDDGNAFNTSIGDIGDMKVSRGAVWSTIEILYTQRCIRLRGDPNRRARNLVQVLTAAQADLAHRSTSRPRTPP
jgi:hypothetical protein